MSEDLVLMPKAGEAWRIQNALMGARIYGWSSYWTGAVKVSADRVEKARSVLKEVGATLRPQADRSFEWVEWP